MSSKSTSGPSRRESALAHKFRVVRDLGGTLSLPEAVGCIRRGTEHEIRPPSNIRKDVSFRWCVYQSSVRTNCACQFQNRCVDVCK